ncbi:DCC1-like thiol-disulfide oxidoreductase family protein [Planktotalea sp.]|uniref:thiol-disulfide oxidoreductase DCC family protein n=1 Tax=Planktotalea sp. TaxID=2029877 RepID=UPI0032998667
MFCVPSPAHAAMGLFDFANAFSYRESMPAVSDHTPYSYREDAAVPDFTAGDAVCVMDAKCSLCARGARWIARQDKRQEFAIIPMQSDVGAALLVHYGMSPSDPTSWLYLENGFAFSSLDAVVRTGQRLGGIWRALAVFNLLPRRAQDAMYQIIARNRYRFFGEADICALPDPDVQKRLLK